MAAKSVMMTGKRAAEWAKEGMAKLHKPLQDGTNRVPSKLPGAQADNKASQQAKQPGILSVAQAPGSQQAGSTRAGNNVAVERSAARGSTSTGQKVRAVWTLPAIQHSRSLPGACR